MSFDENYYNKPKKAQQKVDSVQNQLNQATDNDYDTLKERLDSIELELIQIKQRLEVLENQVGEPTEPPIDDIPAVLSLTPGGTFSGTKQITMSVNEPADIYYTLDGSTPTINSTKYSTPITISDTTILQAFAIDTAGNESTIQTVTYTLEEIEPPNNITNLLASSIDTNEVILYWTASSSNNVIGYDIYKNGVFLTHVTTTSVLITDLLADTEYTFNVKAKDNHDNVSSGVSVTVKTEKESKVLSEVSNLSETHTEDSVTLTWMNPTDDGFSHVKILRDGIEIANHIKDESYQDATISVDTSYEYKVISVYLVNSAGIVKSVTTDEGTTDPPSTTYLSFNGVDDFAEAMNSVSLVGKKGHVIKATIRIPQKMTGNRGFFGFNNTKANQYNEAFLLSESEKGRMAYWNRGFVYGQPLPIGEWIDIEWRHENNNVTFIVKGEITGQGDANPIRTDNTNFWLGKTNIDGEFGEFDIKMLEVEGMLFYDFTEVPEDPTIITDSSGNGNHAKLIGGEWVQIEDPEDPTDPVNLDGGSFKNTSFERNVDGGLFNEPQNGKSIDGGGFNG